MNFLRKIFGRKQPKKEQQRTYTNTIGMPTPIKHSVRYSEDAPAVSDDMLSPLNPISPLWALNNDFDNSPTPDNSSPSIDDFSGFGGGDFGGGGASDSWGDNSSSFDSGSSFDSSSSGSSDW